MSRKQPPLNSHHHESNHSVEFESSFSAAEEASRWQQLWDRIKLHGHQTSHESEEEQEKPLPETPIKSKPVHIKLLFWLLSKLPRRKKPSFDPKQVQQEILEDIGRQLYQARQKQQLTLEVISTETRISVGLLTAIEKGKVEDLPEGIYTRGFIKKFANFLGLNGQELADSYPIDVKVNSSKSSRLPIGLPILQLRPIHLYFIYILIVILSVQSISNTLKRTVLEGNIDEKMTPAAVKPSTPKPVKKPIMVKVHLTGECSLKVVVDGKTKFDGVLPKDSQKTWEAAQNITIKTSNAGLILVGFNQQKAKRLGKLGEEKQVTYQLKKVPPNPPKSKVKG
ncbi:helix-turn-helix domain-containing protein [Crocosphaera sp. XPORK-15E]|uniref:helix-turn-helix domain-containing protein n=1 Tax=Crocosphaera sp. XPORK-15E TaxID=3110247 RepID=UPI002B1FA24C|nr:RodZ domain-containing protein [Crocosphaera sp. XPORK-15E]MEA5534043.1 RodZ domain-containing protein [Crocosphaera sp. XPORK-15E]